MYKVELEFKRIQTYLFASPRLRAMLGANAVLGRTIRIELTELAKSCGAKPDTQLLVQMPCQRETDPLCANIPALNPLIFDNPKTVYADYGVLVRDGGHFIATFPEKEQANEFIQQANRLIATQLPGILVEAQIDQEKISRPYVAESLFQHPSFQVSHRLGNRPAASEQQDKRYVSADEQQMEEAGRKFRENPSDIIGFLEQKQLIPCPSESASSLSDLSDDGYLALIHADGNSIGKRYQAWRNQPNASANVLTHEAHGERFFHSMRVAVRQALVAALQQVFATAPECYQLLMLGGDDLLLACSARYALCFVAAYAKELEKENNYLCDKQPLTIGVGVAIAKDSFPFYRLHAMAEELADSAKKKFRSTPELGSVVDWHISSNAWVNDPIAERRMDSLNYKTVLSGKPYAVCGKNSLAALLKACEQLQTEEKVARSQLRQLVDTLRQGRHLAELAWLELPEGMQKKLQKSLSRLGQTEFPLSPIPLSPMTEAAEWAVSVLPDLVDLFEITRRHHCNKQGRAQ